MASSPKIGTLDTGRRQRELNYASRLREFSPEELRGRLDISVATWIHSYEKGTADTDSRQPLSIRPVTLELVVNTAIYEDAVEDFIYSHVALPILIKASRQSAGHDAVERIRLLRSARAFMYFDKEGWPSD